MTKTFKVERNGKQSWVVIRQMAHDPQYKVGSRIPGLGKVVEEQSSIAGAPTVRMSDGYNNNSTVLFFSNPIAREGDLVKLRCAEPGKQYLTGWRYIQDVRKAMEVQQ